MIRTAGVAGPWDPVDWHTLFVPATPLLEIFVRGTLVYLAIFVLLRVVLKRESGTLGITDLIVVVLIADAAQNAMADDYRSIPEGILLVAVVVGWAWAIDALGFHVPAIERLVKPRPLPLVKDGKPIRENMRKELVTLEELKSQLREQGVEDLASVKVARMESDGRLSVIAMTDEQHQGPPDQAF